MNGTGLDSERALRVLRSRSAAALYGAGGLMAYAAIALPHGRAFSTMGILIPAVLATLVALALVAAPHLYPKWFIHCLSACGSVLVTVGAMSAGHGMGSAMFSVIYVFVAVYAFWFYSWKAGLAHVGLIAVLDAAALVVAHEPGAGVRWFFVVGSCLGAGGVVGWLKADRDRAERTLVQSRVAFELLFASNPHPMWVFDPQDLSFLEVNDAAVIHYGWTRSEFLSMRITDIRPHEDVPAILEEAASLGEGQTDVGTWRHLTKDGRTIHMELNWHTTRFMDRRAVLVVAQDVTDRLESQRRLQEAFDREHEAADQLRALDEAKNAFLSATSHELRTPLSVLVGFANTLLLRDGELTSAQRRDFLRRQVQAAGRLQRLLSDLLDLDRLGRGILHPRRRPTDVAALVAEVVRQTDVGDRAVQLDLEPCVVNVEGARVERIVENLLSNAARYTPCRTTIWVRVTHDSNGVLIVVEDAGPGVPATMRESIFSAFQQGPGVPRHSPGVGIGLSLVARFAEMHGGRACVQDRPGGGASFRVYLPDGDSEDQEAG